MSNRTPSTGNVNYRTVEIEATFRNSFNEIVTTIKAHGFEGLLHAENYFNQRVGHLSLIYKQPLWLSNLVGSNGDFVCQAVPSYWSNGVVENA